MAEYPKDPKKHAAEVDAVLKQFNAIKAELAKLKTAGNAADTLASDAEQIIKTEAK